MSASCYDVQIAAQIASLWSRRCSYFQNIYFACTLDATNVLSCCCTVLIASLLQTFTLTSVLFPTQTLLDDDRIDDVRRMYLLYGRVKAQSQLQQAWLLYCRYWREYCAVCGVCGGVLHVGCAYVRYPEPNTGA
jgi:hypothetical protein